MKSPCLNKFCQFYNTIKCNENAHYLGVSCAPYFKNKKKQVITIEVPDGKTYKQTTDEKGNIIIEYFDIEPVRSKSWEEFCINHPEKFAFVENIDCPIDLSKEINTLVKLTCLHDEWVNGWSREQPISNGEVSFHIGLSYHIGLVNNNVVVIDTYREHALLDFPTKDMADEFLNCFKDLLEIASKFI